MTLVAAMSGARAATDAQSILDRSLKDDVRNRSRIFGPCDDLIARVLVHAEDAPVIRRCAALAATCLIGVYANFHFSWDLADIYYLGLLLSSDSLGVVLHMLSHRRVFRKPWDALNRVPIWIMSIWFGEPPYLFAVEHVVNHHAYNNSPQDLSCTLVYQRDSLVDFCRYLLNFLLGSAGIFGLARLVGGKRGGRVWRRRFFGGQAVFWSIVAIRLWQAWLPTVMLFLLPFFLFNLMNRINNWTEHAFIDPDCPLNPWGNSYTILDSPYNHGATFNEGYHATHHLKPTIPNHLWPRAFRDQLADALAVDHMMFEKISAAKIFGLLMIKAYPRLAKHYVQNPGRPRDAAQIVGLLKSRVARQPASAATLKAAAAKSAVTA